jgi:protein-disulfide isomerase
MKRPPSITPQPTSSSGIHPKARTPRAFLHCEGHMLHPSSIRSAILALTCCAAASSSAHPATPVKDASMLKPPAGRRVAIVEWTDLECPACAHAFPIVHAAADQARIPIVHYDFLITGHPWSPMAAVYARYFQDKVSPAISTEYRREVFASQMRIGSPDDLKQYTAQFAASHHVTLPFVLDPTGQLRREVDADKDLGHRMGLTHTPTIFVVTTHHYIDIANADDIEQGIKQAEEMAAKESGASAVHRAAPQK